jgi:predicted nucleic acid-binding protein
MIVVSDTTAITSLIQINRTELLSQVFGQLIIPAAVERELLAAHASLPEFISVQAAHNERLVQRLRKELGPGESEAIALA